MQKGEDIKPIFSTCKFSFIIWNTENTEQLLHLHKRELELLTMFNHLLVMNSRKRDTSQIQN